MTKLTVFVHQCLVLRHQSSLKRLLAVSSEYTHLPQKLKSLSWWSTCQISWTQWRHGCSRKLLINWHHSSITFGVFPTDSVIVTFPHAYHVPESSWEFFDSLLKIQVWSLSPETRWEHVPPTLHLFYFPLSVIGSKSINFDHVYLGDLFTWNIQTLYPGRSS